MKEGRDSTFAQYFVDRMIAGELAEEGLPSGLAAPDGFDFVLSGTGPSHRLYLIVDREHDPSARVSAASDGLAELGEALADGREDDSVPVEITLWEFSAGFEKKDEERLSRLASLPGMSSFGVTAWIVDVEAESVWTTDPLGGHVKERALVERWLAEPRMSWDSMVAAGAVAHPGRQRGWAIVIALTLAFGALYYLYLAR